MFPETRKLLPGLTAVRVVAALFGIISPLACAQDNRGGVILVLKDPTPRPPELEKLYPAPAPKPTVDPRTSQFNQRRYTLISHAADQIASLAAVLKRSMADAGTGTSLAPQGQVAGAIAGLAGNIYGSLTTAKAAAQAPATAAARTGQPADRAQLAANAAELDRLSQVLKLEVARSDPNALPAGVILQSARVRDLAQQLQDRMQHP